MASDATIHLYVISFCKDFHKEREIIFKEVVSDLRAWCESRHLQLVDTDVQWGGCMKDGSLRDIQQQIREDLNNGRSPYFIHITSDSLGLVPVWGQASEVILQQIHDQLQITQVELDLLYGTSNLHNPNSIVIVRDDSFQEDLMPEEKLLFTPVDFFHKPQLELCHKVLQMHPLDQVLQYQVEVSCDEGSDNSAARLQMELNPGFTHLILELLKSKICETHPFEGVVTDIYLHMKHAHQAFMTQRSPIVKGRESTVQQIEQYICSTDCQDVPLLLLGGAGSGKSSIMASATQHILNLQATGRIPCDGGEGSHLFYHFVGAVPGSTELELMLKRILRELSIVTETCLPRDLDSTAQMVCSALSNPSTRPVVLMVDAVNQFDKDRAAEIMSWLPRKLAPQVRCVLSMINDTMQHKKLLERESKPQELHMVPLECTARKEIVEGCLSHYNQSLSEEMMNLLLSKRASENPLWLSVACEELRFIHNRRELQTRIQALPDGLLDLLSEVLARLEGEREGPTLVATLCLLEASAAGLQETELLAILGAHPDLQPPSPYEEKDEKECSEKDCDSEKEGTSGSKMLAPARWNPVLRALRPYLRPYGDIHEGRLDFYHRALSKAVRIRYFKRGVENMNLEESAEIYKFWHLKLADYFEFMCENVERKIEELLYHLSQLEDECRLAQCLSSWQVFDRLYNEEHSAQLLKFWRKAGGTDRMLQTYKEILTNLENQDPREDQLIALRYEHMARIFVQAGKYNEALVLSKDALKWEEKELGNRPERMVELYSLVSEIYDEKLKLNDFVSTTQLPDLKKTIQYGRKSIALRKSLTSDFHKYKLGMSLMKLAFSLESWKSCSGEETTMTGDQALMEGNMHIDQARQIFLDLKDIGHYAEALMTKGVLATRGSMEQLRFYDQAMEICKQVYGDHSLLCSRLYINIGIVHEDNNKFVKAYHYFQRWGEVSEVVLGPDHPKTLRAKGVINEPRYRLVGLRVREMQSQQVQTNNSEGSVENSQITEEQINREVEELAESEDPFHDESDGDGEESNQERQDGQLEDGEDAVDTDGAAEMVQRLVREIWQRMSNIEGNMEGSTQGSNQRISFNASIAEPLVSTDVSEPEGEISEHSGVSQLSIQDTPSFLSTYLQSTEQASAEPATLDGIDNRSLEELLDVQLPTAVEATAASLDRALGDIERSLNLLMQEARDDTDEAEGATNNADNRVQDNLDNRDIDNRDREDV